MNKYLLLAGFTNVALKYDPPDKTALSQKLVSNKGSAKAAKYLCDLCASEANN